MAEEWVTDFLAAMQAAYPERLHLVTPSMEVEQWEEAGRPRMWEVAGVYFTEEEGSIVLLFDTGYGENAAYKAASKTVVMFREHADIGEQYMAKAVHGYPYLKLYKAVPRSQQS